MTVDTFQNITTEKLHITFFIRNIKETTSFSYLKKYHNTEHSVAEMCFCMRQK